MIYDRHFLSVRKSVGQVKHVEISIARQNVSPSVQVVAVNDRQVYSFQHTRPIGNTNTIHAPMVKLQVFYTDIWLYRTKFRTFTDRLKKFYTKKRLDIVRLSRMIM